MRLTFSVCLEKLGVRARWTDDEIQNELDFISAGRSKKEQAINKYQYNKSKIFTVTHVRKMTFTPSKIIFQMRAPKARAQFFNAF